MNAIRHYLLVAAGLVIIGVLAGFWPALWTAAGLLASIGLNSLAGVASRQDERRAARRAKTRKASGAGYAAVMKGLGPGGHAMALISVCTFGSLLLAAASAMVLFLRYGWLPMTGMIVLFLGYFGVRETEGARNRRHMAALRIALSGYIAQREAGAITDEQLLARSFGTLDNRLSSMIRAIPAYYEPLLAPAGMPPSRHRALLAVLAAFLEGTEEHASRYSEMHQTVRQQLGLPENR